MQGFCGDGVKQVWVCPECEYQNDDTGKDIQRCGKCKENCKVETKFAFCDRCVSQGTDRCEGCTFPYGWVYPVRFAERVVEE